MFWKDIPHLGPSSFKRLTGVTLEVFIIMLDAYPKATFKARKHPSRGGPSKLCGQDKILLMPMYYREYRTMFHIGVTYGVGGATVCKTIHGVEDKPIKDGRFHLPGKKALLEEDSANGIILIDVSETPMGRLQKTTRILPW